MAAKILPTRKMFRFAWNSLKQIQAAAENALQKNPQELAS